MLLSTCANQVLQEFGGVLPESLLSFEDAQREFISVRALELQRLGISTTDITVSSRQIIPNERDAALTPVFGAGMLPAFVEVVPRGSSNDNERYKVEILPVELIPDYEGARAIAFYGTPTRYRLAWDAWDEGPMIVWYDPIEDITQIGTSTDLTFPPAFWTFLIKKAALNLARVAQLKLVVLDSSRHRSNAGAISATFGAFVASLSAQVQDWEREFHKFRNIDLNSQPHLRRTNEEIKARGFNNVTGYDPLDWG